MLSMKIGMMHIKNPLIIGKGIIIFNKSPTIGVIGPSSVFPIDQNH